MHKLSYLKEAFAYDNATGALRWLERPRHHFSSEQQYNRWHSMFWGKPVGYITKAGRLAVKISPKSYLVHRIIWAIYYGVELADMDFQIDHIDMDPLNNNILNLRAATSYQNGCNKRAMSNNKSGFKGVSWHKETKKWIAQIKINGKKTYLGLSNTPEGAHELYVAAAIKNHGDFARIS